MTRPFQTTVKVEWALWQRRRCLFLSAWGFGYEPSRLVGNRGFHSSTLFLLDIVPRFVCAYVGWPITQKPGFLVLWQQGQQVEVCCSTHAIIIFMHIHAQKGSLKDYSSVSHKTHTHTEPCADGHRYSCSYTQIEINKMTYWTLQIWDSIWKDEGRVGAVKRKQEGGGEGDWAECIWLLNW